VRGLNESGCDIRELISLPSQLLPDNSIDIKKFSIDLGAQYFETENINSESTKEYIRNLSPDIIFSSWPKIIDSELLSIPTYGVIGTHPTALPFNNGSSFFAVGNCSRNAGVKIKFFLDGFRGKYRAGYSASPI
jgi:methionyl-tRNA formyltransferase